MSAYSQICSCACSFSEMHVGDSGIPEADIVFCAAAKRTVYNTHEQELYNGLAALINDAKSVRVHLANAMCIQAQAFSSAVA